MSDFVLEGIDGSNLLGFLAALGALRALSDPVDEVRLSWIADTWRPVLHCEAIENRDELLRILADRLNLGHEAPIYLTKWPNLPKTGAEFAAFLLEQRHDRRAADFLAGLGSATREQEEGIDDTAFRTMGGAGHQDFLGFMTQICEQTTVVQVEAALFSAWIYNDPGLAMRWDPVDYRPHALRAEDPSSSKNKPVSVRGANRLAVEALALFPVLPAIRENHTTGFGSPTAQHITWALWEPRLTADEVRSLSVRVPGRGTESRTAELRSRRVHAIFRAERFTEGRFRNFTPSTQVY